MPPLAATIGPFTFAAPVLAWGLLGSAVPVLIHLLWRRKPQPILFPAARLLLPYHAADRRTQRLRQLLLLACRVLAITLLVAVLMRTSCTTAGQTGPATGPAITGRPVSAVFCLDDSASMSTRDQGRTRLQLAADWAARLLADPRRFPTGSEAALITAGPGPAPAALARDLSLVRRRLERPRPAFHDRPITPMLRSAYTLLAEAANPQKEVYLLTDLAAHAWPADLPAPPADLTAVHVLDVGSNDDDNTFLSWPDLPPHPLPANTPGRLTVRVRPGQHPVDAILDIRVAGELRARQSITALEPNQPREITVPLPALPPGIHPLNLDLQPPDSLSLDNQRFAWLTVQARDRIVLVADDPRDEVPSILAAMIAPNTLDPAKQLYAVDAVPTSQLPNASLADARAVILADVASLPAASWKVLTDYVADAGLLLIIPGPRTTPAAFADGRSLLPAVPTAVVDLTTPLTLAARDLDHPWLKPFADPSVDSINARLVFRRLELESPSPDAELVAPFSDHQPAILSRRVGRGQSILFAISPARTWSQFGSQAAPMILLLHTILARYTAHDSATAAYVAGRSEYRWTAPTSQPYHVLDAIADRTLASPAAQGSIRLPTDQPGLYTLRAGQSPDRPTLAYSVNVAESESDSTRIDPTSVQSRFRAGLAWVWPGSAQGSLGVGQGSSGVVQGSPGGVQVGSRGAQGSPGAGLGGSTPPSADPKTPLAARKITIPLALFLLGLLIAESLFANRIYNRHSARRPTQIPPAEPRF